MRSLAARLGVSAMTVSRALNDRPGVGEATRRRVLGAAAALGYRPDRRASRLRAGAPAGLVGLVVTSLADPVMSALTAGVERACAENAARVIVASSNSDPAAESGLVADLRARGVDGVVVVPAGADHAHLRAGRRGGGPLVLATSPPAGLAADCVLVDEVGGAHRACRQLFRQGHRRIGFLASTRSWAGSERLRGHILAHDEAGVPVDERLVRQPREDAHSARSAARELLSTGDEAPSALLVADLPSLVAVLRTVGARPGSRPPAIVGFGPARTDLAPFPLTMVSPDSVALGRAAAQLVFEPRAPGSTAPRQIMMASSLVGPSTRLAHAVAPPRIG